jgi:D-alanyl-D-alanine carboxypeptidase/D-alanyl-D-alanine-endopeptidase (penicillin-binding protein 4)
MTIELRVVRKVLPAALLVLLLTPLLAYRSLSSIHSEDPPKESSPATSASSSTAGTQLAPLVDELIKNSPFANARWGIHVISLKDGQVIYSKDGDKLFTPASNMKLYTTAVTLDLLGADYRWRTSVFADKQPDANGTIRGDLVLYGRGAPDLISETSKNNINSLSALADLLVERGIRRVTGNVIGDESYFRGEVIGDGWLWNDLQWYFGAEASALSINSNEVDINIVPPAKTSEFAEARSSDTTGYVSVSSAMAASKDAKQVRLGIQRGLSDNNVRVWGEYPAGWRGFGAQLSVHNPALWTAKLFLAALKKKGITVDGEASTRNSRVPESERFDPSRNVELAFVVSKPASELITITNKESNNLYAELLLRSLGRERGAMLGDSPPGRERGDEEAGRGIIRLWLDRSGVKTKGLAIHDGSGLSRLDLVTPESTVGLLSVMARTNSAQIFRDSLPIGGKDGTLQSRLGAIPNRVFAKTGSLVYDNSLSGYILTEKGETLAFSVMCNDQTNPGSSIRVIDQITELLAHYPTFKPEKFNNPSKSSH